jgi:prevent-host-death family protein
MRRTSRKTAEEAANHFLDLLEAAQRGRSTIVTKHGRAIAAIVPIEEFVERTRQQSILPLKTTGRRLCGRSSAKTLRDLRDEGSR